MQLRHITILLTLVFTATLPSLANAKVTQVGPTQFHKQMKIPNSLGHSGPSANSNDSYTAPDRRQQRAQKRMKRQHEQNAANEESRTASDTAENPKHQGRRERNHDARMKRQQQNARLNRLQDRAVDRVTDKAKSLLND